jgi:hypothetical protein
VSTRALPRAGMTFFSALYHLRKLASSIAHSSSRSYLYRSYPAARAEPRVGSFAFSERRLMRRLDTGAMPASGSGDTLRFLLSGTSVAIVIVFGVKGSAFLKRVQVWGTSKLAEF